MEKIKLAVVGCGDIANRSYLPAIKAMADQIELAAVCDVNPARAEKAKAEYGAHQAFTDAEAMLAHTECSGVLVLTDMVPHGPLCVAGLEAGKHVYVEKVMAVDLPTADRMVALAQEKNLILSCAPSTILLSPFQQAKKMIQAGEIGKITLVTALGAHHGPARWDGYTSDPTWFYQPGAGPLFDLSVYPVQILTHVLGPVKRVTAMAAVSIPEVVMTAGPVRGKTLKVETEDTIPMVLDFGDGVFASVNTSYNVLSSRLPNMQFFGDRGSLTTPQFLDDEIAVWHQGDARWQVDHLPPSLYDKLGVAAGLPHWLDCIRTGKQPVNNGPHGRHVLEVLLGALESAHTGRVVEISSTF